MNLLWKRHRVKVAKELLDNIQVAKDSTSKMAYNLANDAPKMSRNQKNLKKIVSVGLG